MLSAAKKPVILAGRVSRSVDGWKARVALAETIKAGVVTDLKIGASFPTDHPLHIGAPGTLLPVPEALEALAQADVILSLDWVDLAGTLKAAKTSAKVIQVSIDHHLHNGWSMDYQGLPAVDLFLASDPDQAVPALLEHLGGPKPFRAVSAHRWPDMPEGPLTVEHLALTLRMAVGDRDVTLTHLPLSWNGAWWPFDHPLDYLGGDGGGGVGGGPGISVGAALALRGSGRLPVAICGDGDYLMSVTALWTAAHYRIPLLLVIANNRSFFNDELHQERVARMRNRPVENRWIGQRISDPDIDLASLARAQGAQAWGPIETQADLAASYAEGDRSGGEWRRRRYRCARRARLRAGDDRRHVAQGLIVMSVAPMPTPRAAAAAPKPDDILVADDIVKRFPTPDGVITAVDHVSFAVRPGEFLSVIGPSGCGKSTLFNIIGGLVTGYEGSVTVAGERIEGPHASVGMVFQEEFDLSLAHGDRECRLPA